MSEFTERNRSVATWLTKGEFELFKAVARANNVSVSTYLRAMIVDVLAEEGANVPIPRRRLSRDLLATPIQAVA